MVNARQFLFWRIHSCYYTGRKFDNDGPYARSIDRIDSNKGYIEGNVVSCTVDINGKKSNLSDDEIELLYTKIVLHKKNKLEDSEESLEILSPDGSYLPDEAENILLVEVENTQEDPVI